MEIVYENCSKATYPHIRFLNVGFNGMPREPLDESRLNWIECTPNTAAGFSAVAYFFGRKLHEDLGVPVGLMRSAVGGTVAQSWTSGDAIEKNMPEYIKQYQEMVMPGHVLDQKIVVYQSERDAYAKELEQLNEIEADTAIAARYAAADFDDSSWQTTSVPGLWRIKDIPSYDGMVWYRKTIEVPAAWEGKDLLIKLGKIYNIDVTWYNGEQVGSHGSWAKRDQSGRHVEREYRVPGKLVKAGTNVIAVRVGSIVRGGGFFGDAKVTFNAQLADEPKAQDQAVSLAGEWRVLPVFQLPAVPKNPQTANRPSILFNSMIHPLIPFAMRGAIWYQGESNSSNPEIYQRLLTTLITDWRTRWGQGDFPFLVVQLPNIRGRSAQPHGDGWVLLREAQADVARNVPNVGLAVTLDIGDSGDIHPRNKQDVGLRLALVAEAQTYGKDVVASGPTFKSFKIKDNEVIVSFDHVHGGLVLKGDKLDGFGLQGEDGNWVWADAKIQGDQVIVSSDKIKTPTGVCYGWTSNPPSTLFNKAGLPAAQFKSDAK